MAVTFLLAVVCDLRISRDPRWRQCRAKQKREDGKDNQGNGAHGVRLVTPARFRGQSRHRRGRFDGKRAEPRSRTGPPRLDLASQALQVDCHLGSSLITRLAVLVEGFADDAFELRRHVRIQANGRNRRLVQEWRRTTWPACFRRRLGERSPSRRAPCHRKTDRCARPTPSRRPARVTCRQRCRNHGPIRDSWPIAFLGCPRGQ